MYFIVFKAISIMNIIPEISPIICNQCPAGNS